MTIIMRPDKKPFFAATYMPKEGRFGMQGLRPLLMEIAKAWKTQRRRVDEVAERATSAIADQFVSTGEGTEIDRQIFDFYYYSLSESFDVKFGARPLRRTISTKIEDPLSEDILRGKYAGKNGIRVTVEGEDDERKFAFEGVETPPPEDETQPVASAETT